MIKNYNEFVNESKGEKDVFSTSIEDDKKYKYNYIKEFARKYIIEKYNRVFDKLDYDDYERGEFERDYNSIKHFLENYNFGKNVINAILDRIKHKNYFYSYENIVNIIDRLGIDQTKGTYIASALKTLLDDEDFYDKLEELKHLSKFNGSGKKPPIVIGINGKVLTGGVYYSEFLDVYTETEDEMKNAIELLTSARTFYKIISKELDDYSIIEKYVVVDLDKKTKWGTKEHDWRESIED